MITAILIGIGTSLHFVLAEHHIAPLFMLIANIFFIIGILTHIAYLNELKKSEINN
jgi:hypothetical protein